MGNFTAKSWVQSDKTNCIADVTRLGLESAACYNCELAADQGSEIDFMDMEEALKTVVEECIEEMARDIAEVDDLDGLKSLLDYAQELAVAAEYGCAGHVIDLTSLPTFGGEEPTDTTGIGSWDESRVLWLEGWTIEDRDYRDAMLAIVAAAANKEEARQWVVAATNDLSAEIDGGEVYAHNHWLDDDELKELVTKINAGV